MPSVSMRIVNRMIQIGWRLMVGVAMFYSPATPDSVVAEMHVPRGISLATHDPAGLSSME